VAQKIAARFDFALVAAILGSRNRAAVEPTTTDTLLGAFVADRI
jgi:hypothetical protein